MGNFISSSLISNFWSKESPPPMVLVPPIFDYPPLAARTRMLVPAYDLLFGKLALHCLFEDYFEQAGRLSTRIMLKPIEDPHVDLVATLYGPIDGKSSKEVHGDALFRWQRDLNDPNTFMDLYVSNSEPILRVRSCTYYPKYGLGAFGVFPLLISKRLLPEHYGVMGLRYGSENLSFGTNFMPFGRSCDPPIRVWLAGRSGRVTGGLKYHPPSLGETTHSTRFKDLKNWSFAIGYGLGSTSPLSPSYTFGLEFDRASELTAAFYQHFVVQRRVKNPFEDNQIVGITNYIDFGFQLTTRMREGEKILSTADNSTFQVAASWQANKNFLLKGKYSPLNSSIALAFKSWWNPSFTFSFTAVNDHIDGTKYGFGLRMEHLRQASYEKASPNYVMLTPNKEHLAQGILRNSGKPPVFQSEVDSGNFDRLPEELKPMGKII